MIETFYCSKKCCKIQISPYDLTSNYKIKRFQRKSGVFIHDPSKNKVLLIQSNGHLWGLPKGTVKYGETERICAIREVKEETGLIISENDFKAAYNIRNRALYFYVEKQECEVTVQQNIYGNDANGIAWINIDCLEQLIKNGNINISKHCRLTFQRFLQKVLPYSDFIMVKKRGKF